MVLLTLIFRGIRYDQPAAQRCFDLERGFADEHASRLRITHSLLLSAADDQDMVGELAMRKLALCGRLAAKKAT